MMIIAFVIISYSISIVKKIRKDPSIQAEKGVDFFNIQKIEKGLSR